MAIHSNILAWEIPRTEEPGRLKSMGSQRVKHYRSDLTHTHGSFILKKKKKEKTKKQKPLHTVLHSGCIICISTNSATGFLLLCILSSIFILRLFDESHSD